LTVEMEWRVQVLLREQAVESLVRLCGEVELRRRLGTLDLRTREAHRLDDRIRGVLAMEAALDSGTFVRPAGEGFRGPSCAEDDVTG